MSRVLCRAHYKSTSFSFPQLQLPHQLLLYTSTSRGAVYIASVAHLATMSTELRKWKLDPVDQRDSTGFFKIPGGEKCCSGSLSRTPHVTSLRDSQCNLQASAGIHRTAARLCGAKAHLHSISCDPADLPRGQRRGHQHPIWLPQGGCGDQFERDHRLRHCQASTIKLRCFECAALESENRSESEGSRDCDV